MIIAIDPGKTGAIAAMENGKITWLEDMPTMGRTHGKGQEVNPGELASIIMKMKSGKDASVYIEQVSAMPGNGGTSMFHFGESVGVVLGVCGTLQLPLRRVRPQYWKKRAGLIGKEKDASRALAIQLHPEVSDQLARKKDCGRADAICIAEFGGTV
jgi:crossover junction endodeoxyribonuclease RuvC